MILQPPIFKLLQAAAQLVVEVVVAVAVAVADVSFFFGMMFLALSVLSHIPNFFFFF